MTTPPTRRLRLSAILVPTASVSVSHHGQQFGDAISHADRIDSMSNYLIDASHPRDTRLSDQFATPRSALNDRVGQDDRPTMFNREASLDSCATFLASLDHNRRPAVRAHCRVTHGERLFRRWRVGPELRDNKALVCYRLLELPVRRRIGLIYPGTDDGYGPAVHVERRPVRCGVDAGGEAGQHCDTSLDERRRNGPRQPQAGVRSRARPYDGYRALVRDKFAEREQHGGT